MPLARERLLATRRIVRLSTAILPPNALNHQLTARTSLLVIRVTQPPINTPANQDRESYQLRCMLEYFGVRNSFRDQRQISAQLAGTDRNLNCRFYD